MFKRIVDQMLLSTDTEVDNVSSSTPEEDDASVNPPQTETDASLPARGSSPWITDRTATRSNTLADAVYRSFTSPSLVRVQMHTTQPMFTGTGGGWTAGHVLGAQLCPLMDLRSPVSTEELMMSLTHLYIQ